MDLVDNAINQNFKHEDFEADIFKPKIMVCGVGGGGSNTVNRIAKLNVRGAGLVALNTDKKHLNIMDPIIKKVLLGGALTRGMGAGGFPEMGNKAASYSRSDIEAALNGANLVFLAAGMGGGTGTGASPVIAEVAKSMGAIVVSIVTFPFALEKVRLNVAKAGIEELRKNSDTLIVIDNQRLVKLYANLAIEQAFKVADEITSHAVVGITNTITTPSLINLDFADVKTIMTNGGLSMISVGEGRGSNKVEDVVRDTLKNKLLDVDYENASGVLLHVTGGEDLTLGEANEIGSRITAAAAPNANILWGARIDPAYNGRAECIAIFTGVHGSELFGAPEKGDKSGEFYGIDEI